MVEEGERSKEGRGAFFRPRAFEIVGWGSALLAMLFLRAQGMRMDLKTFDYILSPLWTFFPKALLAGVASQWLYRWWRKEDPGAYLRDIAHLRWWGMWLRLWGAAMVMTYGYFWIKVTIPLLRDRLLDPLFWRLDVALHLGLSPSVFLVELFHGSAFLRWTDAWYGLWIPSVFYFMAFVAASSDETLRRRFLLSSVLLWTAGSWLYLALPAIGPCYVFPELFAEAASGMQKAVGSQAVLWDNYQKILAGREGILRSFNPTRGVAAMPSLHVAAHALFAFWSRRRIRPLFYFWVLAAIWTFVGSVATGWHYAVDGYAGILLAWLCYRLSLLGSGKEAKEQEGETEETAREDPEEASPSEGNP